MSITTHISKLLFRYDCVIIPGLGGFVANYHPAQILSGQNLLYPPSKSLLFNKNLVSNDGLLADTLVREEGISYAEALNVIEQFVENCQADLANGKRITISEVGFLYLDHEHNLQFTADISSNFLVDSFGLYPVVANEIASLKVEEQNDKVETKIIALKEKVKAEDVKTEEVKHENTKVIALNQTEKKSARRYWPVAAALVPLAFYAYWIPFKTDVIQSGHLELSDLNPFKSIVQHYQPALSSFKMTAEPDENEWIKIVENAGGPVAKLPLTETSYLSIYVIENPLPVAESTRVAKPIRQGKNHSMHIIGGCFRDKNNADKLVNEYKEKGYASYILDEVGGLHRVAIQSYSRKDEAMQALNDLRSNAISSAWLLEK